MSRRSGKEETDIQAQIVASLNRIGFIVIRIQCGEVSVRGGRMQLAPEGSPDLYVIGWGFIETKTDEGELRDVQVRMHEHIRRAGDRVIVARSPNEAVRAVLRETKLKRS